MPYSKLNRSFTTITTYKHLKIMSARGDTIFKCLSASTRFRIRHIFDFTAITIWGKICLYEHVFIKLLYFYFIRKDNK